jgi:chromosome segregation ATPase
MGRLLAAIQRFINFFFLRRSEDVRNAADRQFTGSVDGIRAAYAIDRDQLAKDFRGLQEAVAQVLTVAEDKKLRLARLGEEEKELQSQLNGAIRAAEQAQGSGDTAEFDKAKAAYSRYRARLSEIDSTEARLAAEVTQIEGSMTTHMTRLTELQARLERLPQEEAETVAEFVSARQIIELNNRLMNAQDSLKEGPARTVREQVRNMSSLARITEKLAGTDVRLQDQQYASLGRELEGEDSLEAVLRARRAQREGGGAAEPAEKEAEASAEQSERPRI